MSNYPVSNYFYSAFLFSIFIFVTACGGGGGGGNTAGTPFQPFVTNVINKGAIPTNGSLQSGDTSANASGVRDLYTLSATAGTDYQIILSETADQSDSATLVMFISLPAMLDNEYEFISTNLNGSKTYGYFLFEVTNKHNGSGDMVVDALDNTINFRAPVTATYFLEVQNKPATSYEISVLENAGGPIVGHPTMSAVTLDDPFILGQPLNASFTFTSGVDDLSFSLARYEKVDIRGTVQVVSTATLGSLNLGSSTIAASATSLTTAYHTWGLTTEAAGSVWSPMISLGNNNPATTTANPNADRVTTRYSKDWPFINTLVMTQSVSFSSKIMYVGDSGVTRNIILNATPAGNVSCSPPALTANPSLSPTIFSGSTAGGILTVPVDKAAIINAYARVNIANFVEAFSNDPSDLSGTDTTVGAGNASLSVNVVNATSGVVSVDYYMDIELIDASNANCRSFYRAMNPMPTTLRSMRPTASTYYYHQNDLTNTQNRVNALSMPVVTFTIN